MLKNTTTNPRYMGTGLSLLHYFFVFLPTYLLCVIRWEQAAFPPCTLTSTKHGRRKGQRLFTDLSSLAVPPQPCTAGQEATREVSDQTRHAASVQVLFLPQLWRQSSGVTRLLSYTPHVAAQAVNKSFGAGLVILQCQGSLPAL